MGTCLDICLCFLLPKNNVFLFVFLMPFCFQMCALLAPFGDQFWREQILEIVLIFGSSFDVNFGIPGHLPRPNQSKKLGGLLKIEGRPFRARAPPGSSFGANSGQKLKPGANKINEKSMQKSIRKITEFVLMSDLMLKPKWGQT